MSRYQGGIRMAAGWDWGDIDNPLALWNARLTPDGASTGQELLLIS